jgi:hypothetical protein
MARPEAGHQELLARLRWPADESGYFVAEDSGLPSYRGLLQMLRDRGIDPPMTWSKRDCVKMLGGIPPYKERSANPLLDNRVAEVTEHLRRQAELSASIRELMAGLGPTVDILVSELEDAHVQRQQQLLQ